MLDRFTKGSHLASFFIVFLSLLFPVCAIEVEDKILDFAQEISLHNEPLWQAILQKKNNKMLNDSSNLWLTHSAILKEELEATIRLIFQEPNTACRFPARKRFIERKLDLEVGSLSLVMCQSYQEFVESVPIESLFLVYASENVTSASSMMGHIMLRMDGKNKAKSFVQHGITFFTELDSVNIPKILYDSLFVGKEGYFQVAPYAPFQQHYRNVEQRNIWEYKLDLNNFEKLLIRDMVWELGQSNLPYFFHTYNCATVTQLLLALGNPDKLANMADWLTPLDVVKFAHRNNRVESTQVIPSDKWKINALSAQLNEQKMQKVADSIINLKVDELLFDDSTPNILALEFAKSYNAFAYAKNIINENVFEANKSIISKKSNNISQYQLDLDSYKNPLDTADEALFAAGFIRFDNEDFIKFRYFPVAKSILDNNRNIFGETELILADTEIRVSLKDSDIIVDKFLLYSMKSRVPFNTYVGGLSTGFKIGAERILDDNHRQQLAGLIEASIGFTYEFTRDLGVYAELEIGAGTHLDKQFLYSVPTLGIYLYSIFNVKLNIESNVLVNHNQYDMKSFSVSAIHYINNNNSFTLKTLRNWNQVKDTSLTEINYNYRF